MDSLDVGKNSTLGNGDSSQEFVQLLIADGRLQVTGVDAGLLVVTSGIAGQLEDFSCQVFHDCGQEHLGNSSNSVSIVSLEEKTV
jgi:hypothetical protein